MRTNALTDIPQKPTESDRFEKYAALIREAHFFYMRSNEKKVWEVVLNRYHTTSRFLPRLTALATLHITPTGTLFDLPLLLPTLRHLSVQLDTLRSQSPSDGGALLTTALERIATEIPSLSSLKISNVSQDSTRLSWKMAPFQSLRRLLDITDDLVIGTPILTAIGQFLGLRALTIYVGDDCSHLQGCLQALVELDIRGRASHIQSFLSATSPPHLQSLSLVFVNYPGTDSLAQCMSTMSTSVPMTLSALKLESDLTFDPPITSVMDVVQPTFASRALTVFMFKFRPLPSISDADILTMLSAWPMLTALHIAPNHVYPCPTPQPVRPTALVFPAIAARTSHLDTLELPEVDLSLTPALDVLPWPRDRHPLRALDMASGPYSDGSCADRKVFLRAAAMLDRLFRSMELPGMRGDAHDEGEEKGWDAVVRLLHVMQAGRAHADGFERAGGAGERDDDWKQAGGDSESDEDGDSESWDEDMRLE